MIDTEELLMLLELPDVGPKTVFRLLRDAKDDDVGGDDRHRVLLDRIARVSRRKNEFSPEELETGRRVARQVLTNADRHEITVIGWYDPDYPAIFRTIPDPPLVLYVKGDLRCLTQPAIAVIGTRSPTPFGAKTSVRIGARLAELGIVVVSGLALGCDTGAHEGCVDRGGRTVAVLAHGLDMIYPAKNRKLAERILASDGCLVSEYPPGEKPNRGSFVQRDRLQSGLSRGVIVIETGLDGGSMHAVRAGMAQGRRLGCVKHPPEYIDRLQAAGNRKLIDEGKAKSIASRSDLEYFVHLCRGEDQPHGQMKQDPQTSADLDKPHQLWMDGLEWP